MGGLCVLQGVHTRLRRRWKEGTVKVLSLTPVCTSCEIIYNFLESEFEPRNQLEKGAAPEVQATDRGWQGWRSPAWLLPQCQFS